jgi:hypothetical protein
MLINLGSLTSLLIIVTAKKRPPLDAQNTRAIYKKRYAANTNPLFSRLEGDT